MSDYDDHARAVPDLARQTLAAFQRVDAVALWHRRADATVGGAATSPVTGGGRSDPTASRRTDPPPDIGRAVGRLHDRLQDSLSELQELAGDYGTVNELGEIDTAADTPTRPCTCCASRTACVDLDGDGNGLCQRCSTYRRRRGRACDEQQHRRWNQLGESATVPREELCNCRGGEQCGRTHPAGGCTRRHADNRKDCWGCINSRRAERGGSAA